MSININIPNACTFQELNVGDKFVNDKNEELMKVNGGYFNYVNLKDGSCGTFSNGNFYVKRCKSVSFHELSQNSWFILNETLLIKRNSKYAYSIHDNKDHVMSGTIKVIPVKDVKVIVGI